MSERTERLWKKPKPKTVTSAASATAADDQAASDHTWSDADRIGSL